jgi:hypothetical protein
MLSIMMKQLIALVSLALLSTLSVAQMAPENEISRECVYGDCQNGFGTLEIRTEIGIDRYEGNFTDGIFDGYGKYEKMITRSDRAYYDGNWDMGIRQGRGTYWDGQSDLVFFRPGKLVPEQTQRTLVARKRRELFGRVC